MYMKMCSLNVVLFIGHVMSPHHFDQMSQKVTSLKVFSKCLCHCLCICVCNFFVFRPGQFDFQLFRTLLARYARSLNITVAKIIIMIIITIIIIRENVAVVNVFLNAPQTQILDVNEKTSIIDVVKIVIMIIFLIHGDDDDFFFIQMVVMMIFRSARTSCTTSDPRGWTRGPVAGR